MNHIIAIVGMMLLVMAQKAAAELPTPQQYIEAAKLLNGLPARSALERANETLKKQITDAERASATRAF